MINEQFIRLAWLVCCGIFLAGIMDSKPACGSDLNLNDFRPTNPDYHTDTTPLLKDSLALGGYTEPGVDEHDIAHVEVPEPLLFDLVRPLGARKGEVEINTLSIFPWAQSNTQPENDDPFGPGPTTLDKKGIEWAPELEYAIVDNFAIEFEFPFENSSLEEYKLGLQWTIGTAFDNHYIHGIQMLVEPTVAWEQWNTTLLYLGGIRFNETWSALFMIGGRMDLEGAQNSQTFERILNISLFADVAPNTKLGVETNGTSKLNGESSFIVVPQIHYDLTESLQVQSGLGLGTFSGGYEQSFIIRAIASW